MRELINILDRARALEESDFAKLIDEHIRINRDLREPKDANELPENLAEAMRAHVKSVYARHGGNMAQARNALGLSLNTLKKYLRSKAQSSQRSRSQPALRPSARRRMSMRSPSIA